MMAARVRVTRNRYRPDRHEHPWLVSCGYCVDTGSPFVVFGGFDVKGWAPTWEAAQQYADAHAKRHQAKRCPTCGHVPEKAEP